jgi:hypothetical protein
MYARLGFAIAAHVDPEILLVDEVLSVGDAVFRLRCLERMRELVRGGATLIFVTHDLEQMRSTCRRAIVLEKGRVCFEGSATDAVGQYLRAVSQAFERPADIDGKSNATSAVALTNFRWLDEMGSEVSNADSEGLRAELTFLVGRPIRRMVVELNMRTALHEALLSFNSGRAGVTFDVAAGEQRIELRLASFPLAGGQYFWNVRVWDADRAVIELDTAFQYPLVVRDTGQSTGALRLPHNWSFVECPSVEPEPAIAGSWS